MLNNQYFNQSYGNIDQIQIKIDTHKKYANPKGHFHDWLLENTPLEGVERILDIACGTGNFLECAAKKTNSDVMLFGVDSSLVMVEETKTRLELLGRESNIKHGYMEKLPFIDEMFDLIVINHALYYASDISYVIGHAKQKLKSNGRLFLSTNARSEENELLKAHLKHLRQLGVETETIRDPLDRFNLDNGHHYVKQKFDDIKMVTRYISLVFEEIDPLMSYYGSSTINLGIRNHKDSKKIEADLLELMRKHVTSIINLTGRYSIDKRTGYYEAKNTIY